ncbi:MAG: site-specific integrase [Bacillota bacterium]|nr:site-specific integrase [Bacillota bacterium]
MIKEIYQNYLNKFYEMLELQDLTKNTIKNYTSFLLQYLTWINTNLSKYLEDISYDEIRLYILKKPFDKYEVPFMKTTRKLPTIYSKEIIFQFIDSFKNIRHKAYAAILYSSGIRVSELQHLRYEDFSRKNMMLRIKETKSRTDRYAILSKNALAILTKYWNSNRKPKGYLFPGYHYRNKSVSKNTINNVFNDRSKTFGVKITPVCRKNHKMF